MSSPFDFTFPPFDVLNPVERSEIAKLIDIEYHPSAQTILSAQSPMQSLYIVMKGLVVGGVERDIFIAEHELFDGKSLLEGICAQEFIAQEDTLLWRLPRDAVLKLCQHNSKFAAFFYQDVARRMAELSPNPEQLSQATLMLSRVRDVSCSPVVYLDAEASVLAAAQALQQHHLGSLLIKSERGLGIFTQTDLRNVVARGLIPSQTLAAAHASYALQRLSPDMTLHQAMILMIRHGIHHLLIEEHGKVIGVLEQTDLLNSLAHNPQSIGVQIERATQLAELDQAADRFIGLIQLLQHSGMKVSLIAELIGELRQKLLGKLFSLLAPRDMLEHVCLLVLGSEGRGEQILRTDQDNALIIADQYKHPDLASICQRFTATLERWGYPPCPGGIMISNPEWRKTLSQFRHQIEDWASVPHGDNVMKMAVWLDASAVIGNTPLMYKLKEHINNTSERNTAYMSHFALPVELFPTPLGLFSRLVTDSEQHLLDLKKGGIFPITHGLRSLALEAKIEATNSYQRLAALSTGTVISKQLAQDLAETLSFFQTLQLKYCLQAHFNGKQAIGQIDPSQLSALERDLLKDALGVVKQFRALLRHHFHLDQL